MTDYPRVQRALFCMQCDESFACAVFAGEEEALDSTGLGPADLALLRALDPAGVAADPGGRRRAQVLGNAASEYALTIARAERDAVLPGLLEGFASSPELHRAIWEKARLPLAFGAYARRRAGEAGDGVLAAFVELEAALAEARRAEPALAQLVAGEVVRSPRAHLIELPAGTLERAERTRAGLEASSGAPEISAGAREVALLLAAERASPHRLPDVRVERLEPAVAALLEHASRPVDAEARARFARGHGAEPAELEGFVDALIADGILVRGSPR